MTTETKGAPSTEKKKGPKIKGTVEVSRELCKGCGFCIEFCPTGVLELDKGFNSKGYHPPLFANPDMCNGCDMCGLVCPDFAIFGYRLKPAEKPAEKPAAEKPQTADATHTRRFE